MKNGNIVLVLALFAVLAAPTMGLANTKNPEPVTSTVRAQVYKTDVSVRTGPGSSYKEVARAKKGAVVAVLSSEDSWVKVKFSDGVSGWIHKSMLKFPEGDKAPSQQSATPNPAPVSADPDSVSLPETPTRIVTDVDRPKRMSISISDGKASIRKTDGTVEHLAGGQATSDGQSQVSPQPRETVLAPKPLDIPEGERVALPPLERPKFAPVSKPVALDKPKFAETKTGTAAMILNEAVGMKGITYRYGAEGSRGAWDCSAFVRQVFSKAGISLPRTAMEQYGRGTYVKREDLQPGDLVFFTSRISRVGHVGIYWGDGKFIHCSSGKNGVAISGLDESYYSSHYVGAKRILTGSQRLSGPVPLPDSSQGENN